MNMSITGNKKPIFTSSDLAIVATISLYFPIESIDRQNPRKAQFVFVRNTELNNLIERYWKKELLIEPRQYFDQLKAIKNRLYANE